jgi:hypothetical protein
LRIVRSRKCMSKQMMAFNTPKEWVHYSTSTHTTLQGTHKSTRTHFRPPLQPISDKVGVALTWTNRLTKISKHTTNPVSHHISRQYTIPTAVHQDIYMENTKQHFAVGHAGEAGKGVREKAESQPEKAVVWHQNHK